MRRRNVKNAHERLLQYDYLTIYNDLPLNLNFNKVQPIQLEIGMGKGKFIIEKAKRNPNINFIGVEKYESVILQACTKLDEVLPNLQLVCMDAKCITSAFKDIKIDKIYLNFSDPWPKARHAKRRLTSSYFLKQYEELMNNKPIIEFKTDNRGLFEYSLQSFNENNYRFEKLSLNLHEDEEDIITTEYEDKFSQKGNPIYYVMVSK